MEVNVCIPTLNRYDLLFECLKSAREGTVTPDRFWIIDNGGTLNYESLDTTVYTPTSNIGVAASWNWFINLVPDMRIICNDDIVFYPDTIEKLLNAFDGENPPVVSGTSQE